MRGAAPPAASNRGAALATQPWTDEEVVERVLGGEAALFEVLMRRHNQRLFRVARAILRQDDEAEDVLQEGYVRAFRDLRQFRGDAPFGSWLARIVVHESLARRLAALSAPRQEAPDAAPAGS